MARSGRARTAAICLISGGLVFAAYASVMASVPEPWKRADWRSSSGGVSSVRTPESASDTRWSFVAQNQGTSLHTSTRITFSASDERQPDRALRAEALAKVRQEFVGFAKGIVDNPGEVFDQFIVGAPGATAQAPGVERSVTIDFPERCLADRLVTALRLAIFAAIIAALVGVYHLLMLLDEWRRRCAAARYGTCTRCGYSLTGLDASAPCPECGSNRSA